MLWVLQLAFGEFYRIEQLILSTNPAPGNMLGGSGERPPIVNDDNIRLMFAMQAEVDALNVPFTREGGEKGNATLQDVCYKPMGDECAIQSVLQVQSPGPSSL
jgi:Niemann-Pick C1 protein